MFKYWNGLGGSTSREKDVAKMAKHMGKAMEIAKATSVDEVRDKASRAREDVVWHDRFLTGYVGAMFMLIGLLGFYPVYAAWFGWNVEAKDAHPIFFAVFLFFIFGGLRKSVTAMFRGKREDLSNDFEAYVLAKALQEDADTVAEDAGALYRHLQHAEDTKRNVVGIEAALGMDFRRPGTRRKPMRAVEIPAVRRGLGTMDPGDDAA